MLGWRGASRYSDAGYREGFALECAAIREVRHVMGFTNMVLRPRHGNPLAHGAILVSSSLAIETRQCVFYLRREASTHWPGRWPVRDYERAALRFTSI